MTEQQPLTITEVPEQKQNLWTRNKARAGKVTAIAAVVGLSAFALGRKSSKACACPSDSTDVTVDAGQTDPV